MIKLTTRALLTESSDDKGGLYSVVVNTEDAALCLEILHLQCGFELHLPSVLLNNALLFCGVLKNNVLIFYVSFLPTFRIQAISCKYVMKIR